MISKTKQLLILSTLTHLSPNLCATPISLVATLPEIAWMAKEIGGDLIVTHVLLSGSENPHFVDAVPEFIRLCSNADIVCAAGLDLEIGYLPAILSRSGNSKVQPGGLGYCELGSYVKVLDKPPGPVDRSMGDVHPSGNPHFYLSPDAMADGAAAIAAALKRIKPEKADLFQKGLVSLQEKLSKIRERVELILAPLSAEPLILMEYHREFSYFFSQYKLKSLGAIEEKPGVPPSAGRLAEMALAARKAKVSLVLAADYSPAQTLKRFEELAGVPVLSLPTLAQKQGSADSYETLQIHIAEAIVKKIEVTKGKRLSF